MERKNIKVNIGWYIFDCKCECLFYIWKTKLMKRYKLLCGNRFCIPDQSDLDLWRTGNPIHPPPSPPPRSTLLSVWYCNMSKTLKDSKWKLCIIMSKSKTKGLMPRKVQSQLIKKDRMLHAKLLSKCVSKMGS